MVIGLSGVAGAGKDLFYKLLSKEVDISRFSLADNLKEDVTNFTLEKYGIHALNCSRKEKEIIRPFLITHGSIMRGRTNGRYWIEKLQKQIEQEESPNSHICITDIRYDEYDKDEVYWLKTEMNGILIHISQFHNLINPGTGKYEIDFLKPPNEMEEKNDPKLKKAADFCIEWPYHKGEGEVERDFILFPFAQRVVENFELK
ncbi:hypothetical protein CL634_03200 [bacterium]|nr:hypothetical protein [bacterium]